jgi:hypothetical protein
MIDLCDASSESQERRRDRTTRVDIGRRRKFHLDFSAKILKQQQPGSSDGTKNASK